MKSLFGIVILLALVLAGIFLYTESESLPSELQATPSQTSGVLPYGSVTLKLNQLATFKDVTILPLTLEEDSRCPSDVQCIQAGVVRVKIQVVSGLGTSTSIVTLGSVFTTEGEAITLTEVTPGKVSTVSNKPSAYSFTFMVVQRM